MQTKAHATLLIEAGTTCCAGRNTPHRTGNALFSKSPRSHFKGFLAGEDYVRDLGGLGRVCSALCFGTKLADETLSRD